MIRDTLGPYVRRRLERWGEEFALSRDCEYLGHQSKNVLQVLIDHKGEMPARAVGFKPLEVDAEALQIEQIVTEIAKERLRIACALRAYWCGMGRRKVERYETALLLISTAEINLENPDRLPSCRTYQGYVADGERMVMEKLFEEALAA